MIRFNIHILALCLFGPMAMGAAIPKKEPTGWLWYQEAIKAHKNALKVPKKIQDPIQETERIKKAFEVATARAVLHPTFQNVQSAQQLQSQILDQAERFQKMWQWVAMLDAANWKPQSHSNRVHREIMQGEEAKKRRDNLKALAKTHGLFLFFKESCPYCHAFAPIVKQFGETYGFEVKAVSYDGGSLKEFPNAVLDNGAVRKLNPYGIFPALLLINPTTGDVIPLSWGMNAISVLEQQASLVYETLVLSTQALPTREVPPLPSSEKETTHD